MQTECQVILVRSLVHDYIEDEKGELIGCFGITEPDHGSDWIMGTDDPKCRPSVTGVLKGDEIYHKR